jgi:amino-acid N-acetyltransferase
MSVRPATLADVPAIHAIVNDHAERGRMLFKSWPQLYEQVRDFAVAEDGGEVVGCVALAVLWRDLAEVRSLAVAAGAQGRGLGRRLTEWSLAEAERLGVRRVMSLTYEEAFFAKFGFEVVPMDTLPLKVWKDCVRCPKRDACDEIAMIRVIDSVAPPPGPQPTPTPRGVSVPVLMD